MVTKNVDLVHSWQNLRLRNYLDGYEDTLKALLDVSLIRYCATGFHPVVYGFIIPLDRLGVGHKILPHYIFAIYAKIPGYKLLYVSDDIFDSLDIAKEKTQYYLEYFPLYGKLSRNIYQKNRETSL